ncbi:ABC transporter permease [Aliagarivorans taiwanensis]|uniref:ABC transporter permease n=1 Tax=Aliagarivorans taiwanensis TaxID=561966 RepID=UPI000409736A|nr:ABC transporter permease [Aliagarivorans taiwanensis]
MDRALTQNPQAPTEKARWHSWIKQYPAAPIIVVLLVAFSTLSPYFLTAGNIESVLIANSVIMLGAIGMTMVFLTGGIDLSISTVISASAVIAGIVMAQTDSISLGIATALVTGLAFGALNGFLIGYCKLNPFITTMGTQLVARGIAFLLSQGIAVKGTPLGLMDFSFVVVLGLPAVSIITLVITALFIVLLGYTSWGREVLLLGSNRSAARYSGINTARTELSVYLLAGGLAGVAGLISIINLGNAIPGVGDTLLLIIIGGVVLGGTSMTGGEGSVLRTVLGVAILAILTSGLNLLGIPFYDQLIIQGVLIFVGNGLAQHLSRRR